MATFRDVKTSDLDDAEHAGKSAVPALIRLVVGWLGFVFIVTLPYSVPGLETYRVWTPERELPFTGHFNPHGSGPVVAEASGGLDYDQPLQERELALLQKLERTNEAFVSAPAEPQLRPIPVTESEPVSAGGDSAKAEPRFAAIQVPKEAYQDAKVLIEDPKGSMAHFYEALGATAQRKEGAITRISHWGDSAIASDGMTSAVRTYLQNLFGDSGHGFILATSSSSWYSHKGVRYSSRGWRSLNIIYRGARDGRYGFGGVRAVGFPGVFSRFQTAKEGPVGRKVSRFDIYYLAGPRQGNLMLQIDKGEPTLVSACADEWEDRVHTVHVEDGPHELRLLGKGGTINVYGVVLERDRPGVVYDGLGIVGFIADRHNNANFDHWKGQIEARGTDLMIIMYGGNKLGFPGLKMSRYEKDFGKVVSRFRKARPSVSCLVMSPLDHGKRHGGKIRTEPLLLDMIEVQRRVAFNSGCAYYSVFDAMGGEGSMGRWAHSNPRLGWTDYAHVTKHGAKVLGLLFFQSLMHGYVNHDK